MASLSASVPGGVLAVKVGDSVRIEVVRGAGTIQTAFVMPSLVRPVVRIEETPGATAKQLGLRTP